MAMLNNLVKTAAKPLPDVISPRAHAVIDYLIAGAFLSAAGLFWKRNKRAAVSSLACGVTHLGVTLMTDYPGGVRRAIPFRARREIDLGVAGMTAAMPKFMHFDREPERKFFTAQSLVMTVANELTRFPRGKETYGNRRRFAA